MKMPNWIAGFFAESLGHQHLRFISQYRVKLVQERGLPFVKFRIDSRREGRAIASRMLCNLRPE